jgi:FdhD protein
VTEQRVARVGVTRFNGRSSASDDDLLAVEEPLEIRAAWRVDGDCHEKNISVTLRTPGDDFDLTAGFLFTEGLIRSSEDLDSIRHWGSPNVVRAELKDGAQFDWSRLDRHFYTTSSCGVCGKTSIDALRVVTAPLRPGNAASGDVVHRIPRILEQHQASFRLTGGLHAAAVLDEDGELRYLREDIGRHNAVDKVVGAMLRDGETPRGRAILAVSSRASFELVQKAIVARVPTLAAIGAPSSLAVALAKEFGLNLLGFVRDGRFNVYAGQVA